ncbi:MipA/OmpV family protein [Sphingomonas sp.]|uniref:MipA/OmpV family protein n=1 Tax=Sphingomonas sp. TaxID=28214 RepID=UPI0025ECA7E0|nr:MipA/OmpV family protein [Sphingomonas sp.]MBV9526990.1 MipA/OmpV family protein [Sphingomonas sp.]
MRHLLIAAAAVLPAWSAAAAQDVQYPAPPATAADSDATRVRVGIGAQLQPRYVGADGTSVGPLFHVNIARHGHEFAFTAPDQSPGFELASSGGFSVGPVVNLTGRRKESDVGALVGNVSRTVEVGGFAQYQAGDSWRLRAELRKGINGHDGLVGEVSADKIWRDGDRYVFSIGPRVLFSDARYQRAYFGVSPAASLASGLPVHDPGGGVHAVGVASGITYALDSRWGLFGYARYERLVGDAARSPIVRDYGSRNQLSGGLGVNYTFTMR